MGHCKDCKQWESPVSAPDYEDGDRFGECRREDTPGAKFHARGWECEGLYTTDDFGCVQFEAKS